MSTSRSKLTASHWGAGLVETSSGKIIGVHAHPDDPDPSSLNDNIAGSLTGAARVMRPAVRQSWLDHGPGNGVRGQDAFVEISWDKALDLVACEVARVRKTYGNGAIFAGSYGWSSAGRVHHAQSHLKRFLNTQGGFLRSEGNYSYNAALVLMPHIVGSYRSHVAQATRWPVIAENSELVVMFGGLAARNAQVSDGGVARHLTKGNLEKCRSRGVRFINLSPLRSDAAKALEAEWLPPKPGTDVAVMLGLAHTLITESLCNYEFLDRYTTGFETFVPYVLGTQDGQPKDAAWAADISGIRADRLVALARDMARSRTMITCAAGVQRADYGEQPLWMTVTLAAMLGQIGLPGGGYGIGYGVNANIGNIERPFRWGTLPQGTNAVTDFIPVAMISDMLLSPGAGYRYNGQERVFPEARLVWWAGGNPFHHHQDLNRLHAAFQTPQTVIVNEINWTATARHADIVLPVAAPQERMDFGAGKSDNALVPMPAHATPAGEARLEYDIYADLAARLGDKDAFTRGRSAQEWTRHIWADTQTAARQHGSTLPDWEAFIEGGIITLADPAPDQVFLADFRDDPTGHPLPTKSGRIELFCQTIADFNLSDCKGHAFWHPPRDRAANRYPLSLLSGQPATRLHSQLDNGAFSLSHKVQGREPVILHPTDAATRGIEDGAVVEIWNDRGRCLAGARLSTDILEGCVFLWTGAWYDPDYTAPQHRDRHGNPNVLTHDMRSSSLSQSPAAHSAQVDVALFKGDLPPIFVHEPPEFVRR